MEYRRNTLLRDDEDKDNDDEQQMTRSSFSYYESIEEFNNYRYGGTSYSCFHLWKHLLNLICCSRNRKRTERTDYTDE